MTVLYSTKASATGGRTGRGTTEDGFLDVALTRPKEIGGDGARGTNPEQLFGVGYSACFLSALQLVASKQKIKIPDDATVTATVGLKTREDGGYGIDVTLAVHVPNMDRADLEPLVAKAHQVCPYSHALRTSYEVPITIV
jgi:Ohr subfamily peroxiredoxin